ncbi:G-type lectin S-receptor-like serine/threonine-protein kinase At2g19130 [Phoenix dactylifera]|uniref:Receptor-like serine/threonine-protein kinase n=1 Tax=Phoenix dactylifera TaxID=42345 RepID=A0A8B8IZP2_PHODC|nr:G-type lectin S-receptor-like serine/threonine-protein kinase At2g19130 [Phoenix dactylifera]
MSHPLLFPFLFIFFSSLNIPRTFAANSISTNHPLSGNQTIISQGGNFVLGFFQPGNKSNHNYYIGIWFKKVSQLTQVWVANRETPISDPTSSELRISDDGNLVLLNQFKKQVWSTNLTSIASNSTTAVILDSGNLVLRDDSDPSKVFWQSFDHPTDTWLPGSKLGMNKVTGERQHLTSWKNSDDPAPGIFSLEIDPNGSSQYFILWKGTRQYWSSGYWNGHLFTAIPEMTSNYIYNFEYFSNATENYFTYSPIDENMISRLVMDVSGQVKELTWLDGSQQWMLFWSEPKQQCDVYSLCGPFGSCTEKSLPFCSCVKGFSEASPSNWNLGDQSQGCVRNTPLQCSTKTSGRGDKDKFFIMPGMRLPVNNHSVAVAGSEDCELACLNNCSCTAYSYSNGCTVWYGDLLNLQQQPDGSAGETLYLRLAASELPNSKSRKRRFVGVGVGVAVGVLALFAIAFILISVHQRRRMIATTKAMENNLVLFKYGDLQRITKNFSEKLGGGAFGSVFKGLLPDSTVIAAKKLEGLHQGEKQFRTEVSTIGKIQHVNLVRLRGFCSEGTKRLLVYDYMPNGSLDTKLFRSNSMVLDWKTRYQIALGAARGLAYLHEKCRECIIHCDIKPENILLDASFVPKLADFGLAKLVGRDFSRVLTTMRGTRGYLAPEWIFGLPITSKADVYSYGMMLLEIISGRRNAEQSEEGKKTFFPVLAVNKVTEGDVLSLLDHKLNGDADLEELDRVCKVACWCIQDNEFHRPSMGQVVQILECAIEVNMPPIPRSLYALAENSEGLVFYSDLSSGQSFQINVNQN